MRHRPLASALDLRHSPAMMAAPAVPVPLQYVGQLRLFVDASYTATMSLLPTARLTASSSQYLQAAHVSSLDFSTGTNANQFSCEIWRDTATIGNNRCYLSKDIFSTSGKHGWALRTSGTVGQESQLEFWAWNGTANAFATIGTTGAPLNWSQCVVTVDLTVPSVSFYFDGSTTAATTTVLSGTLGTLPTGQTAPLTVGAWNFGGSTGMANFYDGSFAGVRLWRQKLPISLIPALFNGGYPLLTAELLGSLKTYLVASWDLQEAAGTRSDLSGNGNNLSEQNGPISQGLVCASLQDRSPAGYLFSAPRFNYAPFWVAQSPINNQPAIQYYGQHWMHASAPGFCSDCVAGDIFTINRPSDLSATNFDYSIITADKETYDGNFCYLFPLIYNQYLELRMRRDKAAVINAAPRGTTTLSAGSTYVTNQRGFGTGGVASFAYRLNGTADPMDGTYDNYAANTTNVQNQWFASLDSIDSLVLGGLNYDQGGPIEGPYAIQDRFKGYIATALVYGGQSIGGGLTDAANLAVENWARQIANV